MKIELGSAEFILKANQPLSLRAARNIRITCTEGVIWITVGGESSDIFLAPGQAYRVPSNALTLIESIGEGKIHLAKLRPATWLKRYAAICVFTAKQSLNKVSPSAHRLKQGAARLSAFGS